MIYRRSIESATAVQVQHKATKQDGNFTVIAAESKATPWTSVSIVTNPVGVDASKGTLLGYMG